MKPHYLLDEHINPAIQRQLRRLIREIDVRCVGDANAPSKGTLDEEILGWAAINEFILVSEDRRTLPSTIAARLSTDNHIAGVLFIRSGAQIGDIIETLELIWHTSEQAEFLDCTLFIPL